MSQIKSIQVKKADVDRIVNKVNSLVNRESQILLKKVTDITNVVYQTAHAKRAMIERGKMGETTPAAGKGTWHYSLISKNAKRVSDPGASFGVPVDTGALQAAIYKKITDNGKNVVGEVGVDNSSAAFKYAKAMEFGTSRIAPRSYLRTAIHQNEEWIKKYFHTKQ